MNTQNPEPAELATTGKKKSLTGKLVLTLLIMLGLVLVAILLLFQFRERATLYTANRYLAPYRMELLELDGLRIDSQSARVASLRFRQIGSKNTQRIEGLLVHFSPAGLVTGSLESIHMDSAELFLPDAASDSDPDAAPVGDEQGTSSPPEVLPEVLLEAFPVRDIRIDRLTVSGLLEADLTLTSTSERLSLASRFTLFPGLEQELRTYLSAMLPSSQGSTDLPALRDSLQGSLSLDLPMTGSAEQEPVLHAKLSVDAGQVLWLRGLSPWVPEAAIEEAGITLGSPLEMDATLKLSAAQGIVPATLEIRSQDMGLQLPLIRYQEKLSSLELKVDSMALALLPETDLRARFGLQAVATELLPYDLSSAGMAGILSLQGNRLGLEAVSELNGQPLLSWQLKHDLETGKGQGDFELPGIEFDSLWGKLSDFIKPLPLAADILQGSLSGSARLEWSLLYPDEQWQLTGPLQLRLEELTGFFQEVAFIGASSELSLQLMPDAQIRSNEAIHFSLDSLDPGLPIENFSGEFTVDTQAGVLQAGLIRAELFGGSLSTRGFTLDIDTLSAGIPLTLEQIDLARILAMGSYREVAASGRISGNLPLILEQGQLRVEAGQFSALAPGGSISYRPDGSGATVDTGNASLDLVYQALSNYRYNTMEAEVSYEQNGDLVLAVALQGSNPDMNGGQRINLNLNITDNIPALLQSLQSGRTLSEELVRQLETR